MECDHRIISIKRDGRLHPLVICVDCYEARPKNHGKKPHAIRTLADLGRHIAKPIGQTNFKW